MVRSLLPSCMATDRERIARRLRAADHAGRRDEIRSLHAQAERSAQRAAARAGRIRSIDYPPELPIVAERERILSAIREHQAVVVCGETGSGKSTQLPKFCLELGRGATGVIAHTQPRRVAARSIASRVAAELRVPLGRAVGYKVRFNDRTSPDTLVKVMTDGVLLAETQGDRRLLAYDTIIIDEAHERSLNVDFLLGYLRQLLPKRHDLKVIVTSATIDPERFSRHFGGCPVIEVSGRTYPVEVRHAPPDAADATMSEAIVHTLLGLEAEGLGDVLVFLPGEREIREAAEALRAAPGAEGREVLPLYARLSAEEQDRVFRAHNGRRVILATNVAETSLTVPGVRFVIDTGVARINRYSPRSRIQRLEVEPISRASADQRAGRCGRVREGICVRLYSETDDESRPRFTDPEILRTNLAGVILQMAALRLGEVERFPFVEAPSARMIRDGRDTLVELGAMGADGGLTEIGRRLARLPVDPRLGRMLLAAEREGSLREALIIVAGLSVRDPRDRPIDKRDEADAAHRANADPRSDFLTLVRVWEEFHKAARESSRRGLQGWCRERFLSHARMREWQDVHHQLHAMAMELGMRINAAHPHEDRVHRALLTGLLVHVGRLRERHEYEGPSGTKFRIHPGSVMHGRDPPWIVAAELVQTTRLYARIVAPVRASWVERLGSHLLSRTYSEPRWDARRERAVAFETVSLLGLPVVDRRRVDFGGVNPAEARALFIHHALVEGGHASGADFERHNRRVVERVRALSAKLRRDESAAQAQRRFDFYDRRVPPGVWTGRAFEAWRLRAERDDPMALYFDERELAGPLAEAASAESFPDTIRVGGVELPIDYAHDPGGDADGVTITVPLGAAWSLTQAAVDWAVPGNVRDAAIALVRTLPRAARRSLGPAPEIVDSFLASSPDRSCPLVEGLAAFIGRTRGVTVRAGNFAPDAVPEHLRARVAVVDEGGRAVACGHDVAAVRASIRGALAEALRVVRSDYNRAAISDWTIGDPPESVVIALGGASVRAWPAMAEEMRAAAVRLFTSRDEAEAAWPIGVRRLLRVRLAGELRTLIEHLPGVERLRLLYATLGSADALHEDLAVMAVERACPVPLAAIRTSAAFERAVSETWGRLSPALVEAARVAERTLEAVQRVRVLIESNPELLHGESGEDIASQLDHLIPAGFLASTAADQLRHYPRYLAALEARLRRLAAGRTAGERAALDTVAPAWWRYIDALGRLDSHPPLARDELRSYRWMVEELRVSVFSQGLGTAQPVSARRLDEQWGRVQAAAAG
ncbi:MAG: ATP-dependent RNA helicase HrpA [Leptolyngbya sp. PLA2]|nr:ATP-dependent RNA helicase HrpA [Leptolyngbya sp. PL-A2]MCZ7632934.1 ATP-dependent RNA helicase HrpA [Phycisphaerales bacterium]